MFLFGLFSIFRGSWLPASLWFVPLTFELAGGTLVLVCCVNYHWQHDYPQWILECLGHVIFIPFGWMVFFRVGDAWIYESLSTDKAQVYAQWARWIYPLACLSLTGVCWWRAYMYFVRVWEWLRDCLVTQLDEENKDREAQRKAAIKQKEEDRIKKKKEYEENINNNSDLTAEKKREKLEELEELEKDAQAKKKEHVPIWAKDEEEKQKQYIEVKRALNELKVADDESSKKDWPFQRILKIVDHALELDKKLCQIQQPVTHILNKEAQQLEEWSKYKNAPADAVQDVLGNKLVDEIVPAVQKKPKNLWSHIGATFCPCCKATSESAK